MKLEKECNKMGTQPVGSLMLSMGAPMIVSMILQAVYNIVDSAFVSNMPENGEAALNALTLAFPIQMLMVAIGIGTGVGTNALLSRSLGQNNREKANKITGNAVLLAGIIYIVFLLFGFFGVKAYVHTQTTDSTISGMAVDYLQICCTVSFGNIFYAIYEKLLQATGRSLYSTIAQIAGALTNIILDPIMIYGYFGCPRFGVKGAAYATVVGQIVSFAAALCFHLWKNREISNKPQYLRPNIGIIREIYTVGFPAIIAQALTSVMTYGMNLILGLISTDAVTAYGLYYKIQQFLLFAAFGLRDAIVSFNYGMGSRKRVTEGMKYGILDTLVIMLVGTIILEIFAASLSGVFGLSGTTQTLCISAIRVISVSFVFAGANIALQGVFQAVGSGVSSLIVSVGRQFLLVLPVAFGFSLTARQFPERTWLVWLTFPIAEVVTCIIACCLLANIIRKKVAKLAE